MKVQQAIQQQLGLWHGVLQGIMSDCGSEVLNKQLPDATISSIAAIYAHLVFAEDRFAQDILQGKPMIYAKNGWEAKTGIPMPDTPGLTPEWAKKLELPVFQQYATEVFAATDTYLAELPDEELDRKIQTANFGEQTVGWLVAVIMATHVPGHTSEIAALKGVQGLKGLPF